MAGKANGAESSRVLSTHGDTAGNQQPSSCALGVAKTLAGRVLALRQSTENEWDVLLDRGAGKDASSDERAHSHA